VNQGSHTLSFIVIGRNEGDKLRRCFASIFNTAATNSLVQYEVVYVDSDSVDNSVRIASSFTGTKVCVIKGKRNAAIARNVGAAECKGDVLFFIDGDMEIQPRFLPEVYSEREGLKYDFVSGHVTDFEYDYQGRLLQTRERTEGVGDRIQFTVGGIFLIRRELWYGVGGMRSKLRTNEDVDFALRLAKNGTMLVRKGETLAIHHTIPYHNIKRLWRRIWAGDDSYRAVLLRINILNKYQWRIFVRENYSSILLLVLSLIFLVFPWHPIFLFYFCSVSLRAVRRGRKRPLTTLSMFIYYVIRDLWTWLSFLFFWPINAEKSIVIRMY
jgi:glycosyltransferase involved in cell wall biosynthesis